MSAALVMILLPDCLEVALHTGGLEGMWSVQQCGMRWLLVVYQPAVMWPTEVPQNGRISWGAAAARQK